MSDYKAVLQAKFINRRLGREITTLPLVSRISLNKNITSFTDAFDFDISYRLSDKVDLRSADFVEFFFMIDKEKFQVSAGFLEDFISTTSANTHTFRANGRDFLGQLLRIPFSEAFPIKQTTLMNFAEYCIKGSYLEEYLKFKGITRTVVDLGAWSGLLAIPQLTTAKIGSVLQQSSDEVFNVVYQNRHGQMVVWGRSSLDAFTIDQEMSETGDPNVNEMVVRDNYSKVFSEVRVLYTGGEGNVDYAHAPSQSIFNSEPDARQIYNPEVRTFQTSTLVTTTGSVSLGDMKDKFGASILRKSNQNLGAVVIKTKLPFYVARDGGKIKYETNQLWGINCPSRKIKEKMRLVGIGYIQSETDLSVELLFIKKDSLV